MPGWSAKNFLRTFLAACCSCLSLSENERPNAPIETVRFGSTSLGLEVYAAHQVLEAWVRAQQIVGWLLLNTKFPVRAAAVQGLLVLVGRLPRNSPEQSRSILPLRPERNESASAALDQFPRAFSGRSRRLESIAAFIESVLKEVVGHPDEGGLPELHLFYADEPTTERSRCGEGSRSADLNAARLRFFAQ